MDTLYGLGSPNMSHAHLWAAVLHRQPLGRPQAGKGSQRALRSLPATLSVTVAQKQETLCHPQRKPAAEGQ
jgi:hypothetical protein